MMKRFFFLFLVVALFLPKYGISQEKCSVILDADTGNEVDDLFAIVRGLIEPTFNVLGLSSAQWQASQWSIPNTLENSHRLNLEILSYMDLEHIPHPRGASDRLYDWGDDIARHSAAAYHIIKEAHQMPQGEKLNVIVMGAGTNLASAILIDSSIVSNIRAYMLGTLYDVEKGVWSKTDFNCAMDIHAIDVIFNARGLETHIIPTSSVFTMTVGIEETRDEFVGKDPLLDFLFMRWIHHIGGAKHSRILWDVALIECFIHPEYCTEQLVDTPPDNTSRKVFVCTDIDEEKMKLDFFGSIRAYFNEDEE